MSHALNILKCTEHEGVFKPRNDIQTITKPVTKNLVVSEEIQWIHALTNTIIGTRINLIPVVHAAAKEAVHPSKPPPMKYQDLPIYQSPHYEYKDYVEDSKKCPDQDVKILHSILFPKVQSIRHRLKKTFCEIGNELILMKNEACAEICKQQCNFKKYMRCPDNLVLRQAVVAAGTITGIYIGSGTRGILRKMFYGTLGALATGALCFPDETDVVVRNVSYVLAKNLVMIMNMVCNQNFQMSQRLPCREDLPPPPAPLKANQINAKCAIKK